MEKIDEKIVIQRPQSVIDGPTRGYGVWTRKAILRAIWEMRMRLIKEKQIDIFQVYEMTDCIEVHIEGEFVTMPVGDYIERKMKRRALKKKKPRARGYNGRSKRNPPTGGGQNL